MGPFFVPAAFVPDPANLRIWCAVNGVTKQDGNSGDMVFGIEDQIAYGSKMKRLNPATCSQPERRRGPGKSASNFSRTATSSKPRSKGWAARETGSSPGQQQPTARDTTRRGEESFGEPRRVRKEDHMFVPERGKFYRMPVPYGPMPGPRQIPAGKSVVDHRRNPKRRTFGVSYLVERARLEALLPPGFSLWGDPVLTVDVTYMWGIDWLAGRGYNTFGVKFPAIACANGETVHGTFLSVLWENLADPIISGREELGFNKLYCEIPEPRAHDGRYSIRCGWLRHAFFDMELSDLRDAPPAPSNPQNAGLLHYKFMPRTGDWGAADFAGAVLSPSHPADIT